MFCFDTFPWFNATLYFTFPFEFLAKMMKFLALFAGVVDMEFGQGNHDCAWRDQLEFFLKIITNDTLFEFSSKQSFEEQS